MMGDQSPCKRRWERDGSGRHRERLSRELALQPLAGERRLVTQGGIADAGELVGERARGLVVIAAGLHGERPLAQAIGGPPGTLGDGGGPQYGACAVREQQAQVAVAAPGGAAEVAGAAPGVGLGGAGVVDRLSIVRRRAPRVVVVTRRDRARDAASVRIHQEDVGVALGHRAGSIGAPGCAVDEDGALGEFGATILFAGSRQGRTQTMPLAIYQGFEQDLSLALTLAVILLVVSFSVLFVVRKVVAGSKD